MLLLLIYIYISHDDDLRKLYFNFDSTNPPINRTVRFKQVLTDVYIYSLAQSQYVIKIDIDTQKEHIRLNVSAKAFISNNCSKSDGAYIKISKLQRTQNNCLSGSYLLQSVIMMC